MEKKTLREYLTEEFSCAIASTFGDLAEIHDTPKNRLFPEDLDEILRKVKGYIGG